MLQALILFALLLEGILYAMLVVVWMRGGISPTDIGLRIFLLAVLWRVAHAGISYVVAGALRRRDGIQLPWGSSLKAFSNELAARFVSYQWSQPFEQLAMRDEPLRRLHEARPVLLVHGYFSSRGMFVRFRRMLADRGHAPIYTVNLGHVFGDVDAMERVLAKRIEEVLADAKAGDLNLIAHSMGGLVVRAHLARASSHKIHRLVTLGSPHHGTEMASLGLGKCALQMQRSSAWLRALVAREAAPANESRPPTLSIYSLNDDLVYPAESARLGWAQNMPVTAVGHVGLLFSDAVADRVSEYLKV